ncbi:VOC family protein [Devosia sp. 1566]|uniref:VOC family protein n=1 Tax=Devosia sp. 1566 TaxID=2499144 RepID=UPI000FD8521F|nr:VOC family protein [Devosia sp. 1566]
MRVLNYLLLAVADTEASAELYQKLLGVAPVQNRPGFALFVLPNGMKIGLWAKDQIQPAPKPVGGSEISFTEESRETMLATYRDWQALGLTILQEPVEMPFGFTFVAEDPDGHRLRPFVPAARPS